VDELSRTGQVARQALMLLFNDALLIVSTNKNAARKRVLRRCLNLFELECVHGCLPETWELYANTEYNGRSQRLFAYRFQFSIDRHGNRDSHHELFIARLNQSLAVCRELRQEGVTNSLPITTAEELLNLAAVC